MELMTMYSLPREHTKHTQSNSVDLVRDMRIGRFGVYFGETPSEKA
jgi:hypothetical protein